jgi:hypothetical protein
MLGVRVDGPAEAWRWSWDAILTRRARGLARGEPPFFADASAWALEHESERELAGLHAWAWALRENPESSDAFESAARWVIENVQPDHATNRPWAIHVFIERAGDVEARMYAETLLHNCLVTTGEPDFFSACILLDAARALET